ncbi:MAG: glucuronate isomerase [Planctomycetia bacterium]|nr:glucuronate isomerase [Planctomycetia bacterium]
MGTLINDRFLLECDQAVRLYEEYAKPQPILDYHCHLSPAEIAENHRFADMTEVWLGGDHYKWRAMRAAGVPEEYITGSASPREKFQKWAEVFPLTVRHPLFHWTLLELARFFGISDRYLNSETAEDIWNECNGLLATPEFSARALMTRMNVKGVCTTDDPLDSLEHHKRLREENRAGEFSVKVLPTFRPDKALPLGASGEEGAVRFSRYVQALSELDGSNLTTFSEYRAALLRRHQYFHEQGCRLSDHGFELFEYAEAGTEQGLESAYRQLRSGRPVDRAVCLAMSSCLLKDVAMADAERGWVMQLHIGAIRNTSTRILSALGADSGCDSIVDGSYAKPLARFLDALDQCDKLPKTIVYNLNPASSDMLAAMVANFNGHGIRGKMQYGSGWWFLDQLDGMRRQLETASTMNLLPLFVGMLTDSRSFLSYTRHEYFRRILCNLLGSEMKRGLIPDDFDWIGKFVSDLSYGNARRYFDFGL